MKAVRSMVLVSGDPQSIQHGAKEVFTNFQKEINSHQLKEEISLSMAAEIGMSDKSPLVVVYPEAVVYGPIKPDDVPYLVNEHLLKGQIASRLQTPANELPGNIAWINTRSGTLPAEQRIVLERVGLIDPTSVKDYIDCGGYQALKKVLNQIQPDEIIAELEKSGLRGRGGAGFPTGTKWKFVCKAEGKKKYVICNADESEPGTFKDRAVLEGDPHVIIEAMIIAGFAIGADEGYIYIRGEYSLAQERMRLAIQQAGEMGMLGEHILNSGHNFKIHIHSGAGAYICGEETALIESIEGKRGEPRTRPPYPTTHGLWGKPSLVNNVETLANVPAILMHGAEWYRQFGTPSSPGTKVFGILGNVNFRGLIEVPMGITLREVIAIYAQGMKDHANLKLAQTGGSSGSIIPASLQDTPMDFDSYTNAGVTMGSGALLICNEKTCVVDLAKVLLKFFRFESCGKCTPCRVGNQRAVQILNDISEGLGTSKDLSDLQLLSTFLYETSQCGLGQTAGSPIKDILTHFRGEVEAHIDSKVCPVGICPMSGHQA